MEFPYINWMQTINVYETPSHIYLVGSDLKEQHYRVLKIVRAPVPLDDSLVDDEHTQENVTPRAIVENETIFDRMWRLHIVEDSQVYTRSDIARLLHIIQAASRQTVAEPNMSASAVCPERSQSFGWFRFGGLFRKRHGPITDSVPKTINLYGPADPTITYQSQAARQLQHAAALALSSGTAERCLVLSTKCYGVVGVVRFLRGYYLILITKCRLVAQINEHKIFKVEETSTIYIPGTEPHNCGSQANNCVGSKIRTLPTSKSSHDLPSLVNPPALDGLQSFVLHYNSTLNRNRLMADESRYLKLFNSIDLANNFYFSYTYDLTHTLQYNLKPVVNSVSRNSSQVWAVKSLPNDRFVWNWHLIPLRFRPDHRLHVADAVDLQPDWFMPLCHGTVSQAVLSACGAPLCLTLIGRRSRHFAGTRFLKRGMNMVGDVANEVETEQIVHDTSCALLRRGRCSSYVQLRGSVPLFWTQESSKMVVRRPPIALLREDPYFEAFGLHFSNLLKRYGSPIIVLNLMKRREKRRFELTLSEGYERGVAYLSQFLPSKIHPAETSCDDDDRSTIGNPPIQYIAFDIARVQKSKRLVALDELRPIVDACVRLTGLFITSGNRSGERRAILGIKPLQCGLIRVNCVDCLDRTNTAQFVVGRVALAYQLYHLGFLAEPVIVADSKIDRLLQNMYDEHGDTLALQYGGSQLVHNIDTYKKTHKLSSQSRDFVQTLSRYYSNKFSDWDKQCVTNLFLRTYRPVMWPGTLFSLACEHLYCLHYYFLRNSNPLHTKVPTNGHGLEANAMDYLDAILAALAIPVSESLWDATTDNHLHWLQACSRVPLYRTSLTDWCPRMLLNSLPYGLDWVEKSRLLSNRIMLVSPDDARVDWFNERYQPFCYQSLSTLTTIRWVELITHPPLMDSLFTQSGSPLAEHSNRITADDQLTLARPKRFTVFTRLELSQIRKRNQSTCDMNVARSVPNLADLKLVESRLGVEQHGSPGKVKLHTTVEEDTASTSTPTFPRKRYSSTKLKMKKKKSDSVSKDEAGSFEESSSESDSADSTGSFLQFYPPMSISERNVSVVPGRLNREYASVFHPSQNSAIGRKPHNAIRESNNVEQQQHTDVGTVWDWMQTPSPYDAQATDAFINFASVANSYRRYMDVKLDGPRTDFSLLTSSVIQPSLTAMYTYRKCVDLAEGKVYPIPSLSMEFYQATVTLASRLHC
ncbi:uncharacterized protein DEA37_0004909 [Paragonimus westermani]|uniref:SAC domain-containing protein n=1 Tax=Paragonimus westermani TaxID=34504 RepID=A0A5J4P374_9TREM|nr:uncharacterized protein DEA37_0004909 [Paragonimus westermani]